jgi:hypothetical protein
MIVESPATHHEWERERERERERESTWVFLSLRIGDVRSLYSTNVTFLPEWLNQSVKIIIRSKTTNFFLPNNYVRSSFHGFFHYWNCWRYQV